MISVICSLFVCDLCHFRSVGRGFFFLSAEVILQWADKKDVTLRSCDKEAKLSWLLI